MHPVQLASKQVREKKSWRENEDWNLIASHYFSFPFFYITMLEESLGKLPKNSCWSYFIPLFLLILLFAVVTELVTFQFWKILQYLNNITVLCCHITRNFHQLHKILVLISVTYMKSLSKREYIHHTFFSLFPMLRLWPNHQRCLKVHVLIWKTKPTVLSEACEPMCPLEDVQLLRLNCHGCRPCCGSFTPSLPGHDDEQLPQNILSFLSAAYPFPVCNP